MHKAYKKCFPNEDSSVLFSREKCATIHISIPRKQLSRRFHFQTFYIVQQLHREINWLCKDGGCLRAIFFKWEKLLDLSVPQKNVINKDSPPRIFPGHPDFTCLEPHWQTSNCSYKSETEYGSAHLLCHMLGPVIQLIITTN